MNENFEKILLIGLLVLVIGVFVFSMVGFFKGPSNSALVQTKNSGDDNVLGNENGNNPALNQGTSGYKTITTGSTGEGDVSIELTPSEISNGKLTFDLKSNTHSVDLAGVDLKKIATLEYNGKVFQPVSAPALNGHHVSGTLVFDVGNEISEIKNIKLTIKGIPQEEERIFEW